MFIWIIHGCLCLQTAPFSNPCKAQIAKSTITNPVFNKLADGLEISNLITSDTRHQNPPDIMAIRIDPDLYSFRTHHFAAEQLPERMSALQWLDHLNAMIVMNAGQYTPEYQHLGWLLSNGKNIGSALHKTWNGFFVAGPRGTELSKKAGILDREYDPIRISEFPYLQCIQSMMLFDRNHKIRVRESPKLARRSAIGEDRFDRILLFVSWKEYTLRDFAAYLMQFKPPIVQAISLDGGSEAQISIKHKNLQINIPYMQVGLPAVLSIKAR